RSTATSQNMPRGYTFVWRANSQQYEQLEFPSANEVYDSPSIQLLRQAYSVYKDTDASSELVEYFRRKLSDPKTNADEKNFLKFGLGYLHWWADEKDEAL